MALSKTQYDTLMQKYEEKRRNNQLLEESRYHEICEAIPEFYELDQQIAHNSIQKGKALLMGSSPAILEELKRSNMELSMRKIELLVEYGYPKDYLEPIYECPSCKDTGYIGQEKCHCLKKEIIKLLYSQSGITKQLEEENFSTFRYDYYSSNLIGDKPLSPRENISSIIELCKNFIDHFPEKHDNFLLQGNAGVGKTFLSNCIAKAILDKQCSVIYLTSFQLFDILEKHRFQKKYEELADSLDRSKQTEDVVRLQQKQETKEITREHKSLLRTKNFIILGLMGLTAFFVGLAYRQQHKKQYYQREIKKLTETIRENEASIRKLQEQPNQYSGKNIQEMKSGS